MGRALELEDLYRLALVSDPNLSPDGTLVAYVVTKADAEADANQATIWMTSTTDPAPRQVTNGPGDGSPRWTPDGRAILFLRAKDGKRQGWPPPIRGGEPSPVPNPEGRVPSFALDPSGSRLAVGSVTDLD